MKFVIIKKTMLHASKVGPYSEIYPLFTSSYPIEVFEIEYSDLESATQANLGLNVMTTTEYNELMKELTIQNKAQLKLLELKRKELNIIEEGKNA